jgi:hypothetical protein
LFAGVVSGTELCRNRGNDRQRRIELVQLIQGGARLLKATESDRRARGTDPLLDPPAARAFLKRRRLIGRDIGRLSLRLRSRRVERRPLRLGREWRRIGHRFAQEPSRKIVRIDRQGGVDFLPRELNIAGFARGVS